jgi:hypothetical protein
VALGVDKEFHRRRFLREARHLAANMSSSVTSSGGGGGGDATGSEEGLVLTSERIELDVRLSSGAMRKASMDVNFDRSDLPSFYTMGDEPSPSPEPAPAPPAGGGDPDTPSGLDFWSTAAYDPAELTPGAPPAAAAAAGAGAGAGDGGDGGGGVSGAERERARLHEDQYHPRVRSVPAGILT